MKGRTPTRAEKIHIDRACGLGCIVCLLFEEKESPASPHHIDGKTKPGAHFKVIGLCWRHHQSKDNNPRYESAHGNKFRFEQRYGTEYELLDIVNERI